MKTEKMLEIPGFGGRYLISASGEIQSVGKGKLHVMKPFISKPGAKPIIVLRNQEGKAVSFRVPALVEKLFPAAPLKAIKGKLSPEMKEAIIGQIALGVPQRQIAKDYGIAQSLVSKIKNS